MISHLFLEIYTHAKAIFFLADCIYISYDSRHGLPFACNFATERSRIRATSFCAACRFLVCKIFFSTVVEKLKLYPGNRFE